MASLKTDSGLSLILGLGITMVLGAMVGAFAFFVIRHDDGHEKRVGGEISDIFMGNEGVKIDETMIEPEQSFPGTTDPPMIAPEPTTPPQPSPTSAVSTTGFDSTTTTSRPPATATTPVARTTTTAAAPTTTAARATTTSGRGG